MALIFLLCLVLTIFLLIPTLIISQKNKRKLPPGRTGLPIIGESLAFVSNPEKFIQERMNKYSPTIFKTSIAGGKMAVLCGPLGNKFMFSNETNKLVTTWWPRSVSQHLIFPFNPNSLSSKSMYEDHSFLKLESMQHYVSAMDSMAKQHLEAKWAPNQEVKVHPLSKEFTFALACRLFINFDNPEEAKELAEPFFDVAKGIMSAPLNIPGTLFNGAVKGGAIIKEKLLHIIKNRRDELQKNGNNYEKAQDLLSRLLVSCDENGKFSSEQAIANKIIGYLMASFYTTSSTITFVVNNLAEYQHVYDKVLEEQLEISKSKGAGEPLTWADIQKMKYTWNVVCESMRLTPPSHGAFKEVLNDFSYAGFTIPKGWKISWSVHTTYKDPKYYNNPEKFDPSRFEGNGPPPYTFVPFGGGPRMCVGKEYARIEILAFVHNVVTRFKLKKVNPYEKIVYNPDPVPIEGLRICLQPHKM